MPLGVPAPIRSLPVTSFKKFPRLMEPSVFLVTAGVRLTKSASLQANPFAFAFVVFEFFHHTFELFTSVPLVLSLELAL